MPNISGRKDNQTIKFGQLVEYYKRNIFVKYHAENEAGRLVPELFLFFKKVLFEVKASDLQLGFNILVSIALNLACNKSKLCKALDC